MVLLVNLIKLKQKDANATKKTFQKRERGTLLHSFKEAVIILILKPDQDIILLNLL